ncbi:MAG TPA: Hsp20/alpha crystallin family protein [Bacteroidia bacterium]|jgi:HSP20 family protein|nr:Hsp20/alpha crystallin family protein [Bacteroidia bacterium]HNU33508.1 Hsp20/alpha crystallin family protein [Bacteroidia bacterium]
MSLVKRNNAVWGFSPMMSDFFGADDLTFDRLWNKDMVPAVNIAENEKQFEIEFASPGFKKDDFKISVDNGMITVSAERKEEKEEKKKTYTRQEYSYNSFSRTFTLPDNAKEDDIKASYENGVLKLDIAKKALTVSKAKEIAIG